MGTVGLLGPDRSFGRWGSERDGSRVFLVVLLFWRAGPVVPSARERIGVGEPTILRIRDGEPSCGRRCIVQTCTEPDFRLQCVPERSRHRRDFPISGTSLPPPVCRILPRPSPGRLRPTLTPRAPSRQPTSTRGANPRDSQERLTDRVREGGAGLYLKSL